MSLEQEIVKAVHDHERWKVNLRASIDNSTVGADAADIGKDNICAFGRWLYGSTIPKDARYDPNYIIVQFLHSKFHECAGKVVQLLSEGKKAEASALMESDGEYTRTSDQLMSTMVKWKESVHKTRGGTLSHHNKTPWKHISTAPSNCDLQLAVIDQDGTHALVFSCRRNLDGWINSESKQRIDVKPTHWRDWGQTQ